MATITGTPNADTLRGTVNADSINGAAGDDVIIGGGGADTLDGGTGNDRFTWVVGDGSDQVEGGAGVDEQFLTGTAGADNFTLSASGGHVLASDGAETLNIHGVEEISIQPLGGADTVQVGDLSTTEVRTLVIDVGGGDTQADTVKLSGAATTDVISVQSAGETALRIQDSAGGVVTTTVISSLTSDDQVSINGGAGDDTITVTNPSGQINAAGLVLAGGAGNDTITGADEADGFIWSIGDGADKIDGGGGQDTVVVDGSNSADNISFGVDLTGGVTVNGQSVISFVNVESASINAGGGDDTITGVGASGIGFLGSTVSAGAGNDLIDVFGTMKLVDGGAGNDSITVNGPADFPAVTTILGGDGNDAISYNLAQGQHGLDFIDGGTGSNFVVITPFQSSNPNQDVAYRETLQVSGAGAEFDVRNSATPNLETIDITNEQQVVLSGGGAADQISVGDLAGSGVTSVTVDLSVSFGGPGSNLVDVPDGRADEVDLQGKAGANQVVFADGPGGVTISGLSANVFIRGLDEGGAASGGVRDNIVLATGGGNDVIDLSQSHAGYFATIDAGAGNDTITAGTGPEIFQFTFGHDRIDHFNVAEDTVSLTHLFNSDGVPDLSLGDMEANGHILQVGANVLISDGTSHFLTLTNVSLNSLSDSNFIFGV